MLHPGGRRHPAPGESLGARPARSGRADRRFGRLQAGHPRWGPTWRLVLTGGCGSEFAKLGRQPGDHRVLPRHPGFQGRELPFPIGEGVSLAQDQGNQVIAAGVVEIKHDASIRPHCLQGNPHP